MASFDIVVRGGTVVDGTNSEPFEADVGVRGGKIAEIGKIADRGTEEIDARGRIVTPGFVDIHTHYDGQVSWSNKLSPSSTHGVTTVVMGNCGVGFAPCRPERRNILIKVMEGVEDIPDIVLEEGVTWAWQSFPEYLNELGSRQYDIDVAAQVPHGPIRIHVMGQRGVDRERATDDDIAQMGVLAKEGIEAGAFGFSTSRTEIHKLADGRLSPTFNADERELMGIAMGLKAAGYGVMQMVEDSRGKPIDIEIEYGMWRRIAQASGRPVSFTIGQIHTAPMKHHQILAMMEEAERNGLILRGQAGARAVGMILGLECSFHPFVTCPSFEPLIGQPLAKIVAAMRNPDLRASLLAEDVESSKNARRVLQARDFELIYPLGDPPEYFPPADQKLSAIAARRGLAPLEVAYDILLENDGHGMMYIPQNNFDKNSNEELFGILQHPLCLPGQSDGGAHVGTICDASFSTQLMTYWSRDRQGEKLSLPNVISMMSRKTAGYIGLHDRGVLKPGYRADINVIDYDNLYLHAPHVLFDLPAGGRRLDQKVDGYDATIVNGTITYREGVHTGALPGRLVRNNRTNPQGGIHVQ